MFLGQIASRRSICSDHNIYQTFYQPDKSEKLPFKNEWNKTHQLIHEEYSFSGSNMN